MLFSLMLWMPSWGGMINGLLTLARSLEQGRDGSRFEILRGRRDLLRHVDVRRADAEHQERQRLEPLHRLDDRPRPLRRPGLERHDDLWHDLLDDAEVVPNQAVERESGLAAFLDCHDWHPALHRADLCRRSDPRLDVARNGFDMGNLANPEFIESVIAVKAMWWLRVAGGALFVGGVVLMVVNYVMTWSTRPAKYDVPVYQAPSCLDVAPADPPRRRQQARAMHPCSMRPSGLMSGRKMDWHRRWERLPVRFTVLTTLAVVVASLFEIIPTFLIRSNVPTIASVKPYTPLELAGRDIYVSEGCYNCHSQMIRPMVAETKRYGEYSKPGEFIYDRPFQWGSRRIGPDLAREGGNKQTSLWHWQHFENPSILVEGSVMPSYVHLLDTPIDFEKIQDRVDARTHAGRPYERELTEAPQMAREQAERIAADIVSQGGTVNRGDVDDPRLASGCPDRLPATFGNRFECPAGGRRSRGGSACRRGAARTGRPPSKSPLSQSLHLIQRAHRCRDHVEGCHPSD